MKEADLGRYIARKLKEAHLSLLKIHGSPLQRGLPDYLIWGNLLPIMPAELKVADDVEQAMSKLTTGQRSVMRSMARSKSGVLIVWGNGEICGAARLNDYSSSDSVPYEFGGQGWHVKHKEGDRANISGAVLWLMRGV